MKDKIKSEKNENERKGNITSRSTQLLLMHTCIGIRYAICIRIKP